MSTEYLTPAEAAGLLKVHERTVRRWIGQGRIPARRIGRLLRIRREDLDALGEPVEVWASDEAFRADWDNELDAKYDDWEELYGVRKG